MKSIASISLAIAAATAISGCAVLGGGDDDGPTAPKEGRISILALEQRLEPELTQAPSVPEALPMPAWAQPGGLSSNAPGHIAAPAAFEIDWRRTLVDGSSKRERLAAPPIVVDGRVYVLGGDQILSAFELSSGDRLWSADLRPRERSDDKRAIGGGVAFNNGRVFAVSGYGVAAAYDAATGDELWRAVGQAPFSSAPTVAGGRLYAVTNDSELFAIDADTGDVQWTHQAIAEPARILAAPSPAVVEDVVISPFASGEVIALAAANGRRLWVDALSRDGAQGSLAAINDVSGRPAVSGGAVYAVSHSGILAAIDQRTGARGWARNFASTQTPWVAGDAVYAVSVDGELAAFERSSGQVFWLSQLRRFRDSDDRKGRIAWSGPILAGGRLLLTNSLGELVAVDPAKGGVVQTIKIGEPIYIPPIAANGVIYVLDDTGRLTALR